MVFLVVDSLLETSLMPGMDTQDVSHHINNFEIGPGTGMLLRRPRRQVPPARRGPP